MSRRWRARSLPAAALLLLVSACALPTSKPVLRIGTSGDYPPFSIDGRGFDVEVARELARSLGARLEWVRFRWPELRGAVGRNEFDVAMSGVTWRPERAVVGWTSRAVAVGGPCLVGRPEPNRIAVNRGGVLERWARERFPSTEITAVDDNLSLPALLARGEVDAVATDSFEAASVALAGSTQICDWPRDRKVYWIAPRHAADLGPRIDQWLRANEPLLERLRAKWLGGPAPRDEVDHLIDLVARRIELMPAVAAWKRAHSEPIEDPSREAAVLEGAAVRARELGIDSEGARRFFAVQIELAKAVQRRASPTAPALDLEKLRPLLLRLGDQILESLAIVAPLSESTLGGDRLALLEALLTPAEVAALRAALANVRRAQPLATSSSPTATVSVTPKSSIMLPASSRIAFHSGDSELSCMASGLSKYISATR